MDELDRILSSEEPLVPSSGFAARVMEAVRDAATAPPPLPFPWGRFAIGVAACLVFAASFVLLLMRPDFAALRGPVSELAPVAPELAEAAAVVLATFGLLRVQRTLAAQDDFS